MLKFYRIISIFLCLFLLSSFGFAEDKKPLVIRSDRVREILDSDTLYIPYRLRMGISTTSGYVLTADANGYGTWQTGGLGVITSVFSRTGNILAVDGDYSKSLITGLKDADSPTFVNTTLSGRTTTRVAYFTTGGAFLDNSDFTFDGANLFTPGIKLGQNGLFLRENSITPVEYLNVIAGSSLTVNRLLTLTTGDADRILTLNGNPTLNDWFDQSVKQAASPTHAGLNLSDLTASLPIVTDGSKNLASLAYTGATSFRKNLGLETTDSPTFGSPNVTNLIASTDIYKTAWTDYTSSSTVVGWTGPFTVEIISYKQIGKTVFVWFYITGTSNSTSTSFTLPVAVRTVTGMVFQSIIRTQDSGTWQSPPGLVTISSASNVANFRKLCTDTSNTTWTATGTKTIIGQFNYETD